MCVHVQQGAWDFEHLEGSGGEGGGWGVGGGEVGGEGGGGRGREGVAETLQTC